MMDLKAPKTIALILLGVVSLVGPFIEMLTTGKVEDFSNFDVAATVVALPLVFWWYHVDKRERDYQAGPLMNAGILVLAVVAFPIYFVRTRGWKRGAIATLLALGVFAILLGLSELGEWIGTFFI
ncbi:MAG TPA: hypothetical protein VNU96_21730 [Burkholderiales bacterium]|nr:hypothetical protein [Burkholderiales bacterium]